MPEFKEGQFEIQDEASQLVGALFYAEPGQQIMDYCSGAEEKPSPLLTCYKTKGKSICMIFAPISSSRPKKGFAGQGFKMLNFF